MSTVFVKRNTHLIPNCILTVYCWTIDPQVSQAGGFSICMTCSINGQRGLMGINNVPLILMEINGD